MASGCRKLGGKNSLLVIFTIVDAINSKLATYEQLKDTAFFLELVLWKSEIDASMPTPCKTMGQSCNMEDLCAANIKGQYRINCGSDVIIPNVHISE